MIDLDTDILLSPGFAILSLLGILAVTIGYMMSKKSADLPSFPIWQLLIIYLVIIGASYYFASKG